MINNNSQIKENLSSTLKAMIADENLEINFSNIDNNFFSLDDSLIANNKINLPKILDDVEVNKANYLLQNNNVTKDYLEGKFDNQISPTSFATINQNNSRNNRAIYDLVACYKLFHQIKKTSLRNSAQDFLNNFDSELLLCKMKVIMALVKIF